MLLHKILKRVIVVLAVTLLISCSPYQGVEVSEITNIGISSINNSGMAEFVVSAKIKNPNNYQIHLKDAEIDVVINNLFFGTLTLENGLKLKGNETNVQDFFLALNIESLLKENFIQAASLLIAEKVEIKLKGFVKVSSFGLSHQIKIDVIEEVYTSENWLKI